MRPALVALLERWGLHSFAGLVPTQGFVYGVLFVVLGLLFWKRARQAGLRGAVDVILLGGAAAVVGARLYYLAITSGSQQPAGSWLSLSGTGSWGAYLGAAVALGLYGVAKRSGPWPWADLGTSVAPLAEAIGRWGCWLDGDDFGTERAPLGDPFPSREPRVEHSPVSRTHSAERRPFASGPS